MDDKNKLGRVAAGICRVVDNGLFLGTILNENKKGKDKHKNKKEKNGMNGKM